MTFKWAAPWRKKYASGPRTHVSCQNVQSKFLSANTDYPEQQLKNITTPKNWLAFREQVLQKKCSKAASAQKALRSVKAWLKEGNAKCVACPAQ
jgi:hypothetical protein